MKPFKTGIEAITNERDEQIEKHGWTAGHDDAEHDYSDLTKAAILTLLSTDEFAASFWDAWRDDLLGDLNWDEEHTDKMLRSDKTLVDKLAVAGALIAAQIDLICRHKAYQKANQ